MMSWKRYFRRRREDDELSHEIDSYIETETEQNIARGMKPQEARDAAVRKLGSTRRVREEIHEMNSIGFLETLWNDLRFGARLLRLSPGFAVVAILSLALGIGANTAIFELVDAVRLRTIPVKDPGRLAIVRIRNFDNTSGDFTGRHPLLTYALWRQIQERQEAFSKIFAWSSNEFNLALGGEARYAQGIFVSGDFFETLGLQPTLGRLLTPQDDQPGCGAGGAVISYAFWQREYGGGESSLGKKITVNGHPFEIVGVTAPSFYGVEIGKTFDIAVPICSEAVIHGESSRLNEQDGWWLAAMGRLKPGWTIEKASAQMAAISPGIFQETLPQRFDTGDTKSYLGYKLAAFHADTGYSELRENSEQPLEILMGIAGFVLLVACANLANLMLARGSAREREMAVRLAMGAPRRRLVRQLLSESLLIAAIGAALGALLARELSHFLVSMISTEDDPVFLVLTFDWRVLVFTAGLAVLTVVLFGLAPAVRSTDASPSAVLKTSGRGMTAGRERWGLRRVLVISQVALSLVLLVGALMFVRTLRNLLMLDPGFRADNVLLTATNMARLNLPKDRRTEFNRVVAERIRAIPGVEAVAEVQYAPISGDGWNGSVLSANSDREIVGIADRNRVSPGYFHTMGTPLLGGRDFGQGDTLKSPLVAIVNQAFVKKFLNGANPLGKTVRFEVAPGKPIPSYEIVGVVKDSKYMALREDFTPTVYFPLTQNDSPSLHDEIMIRSSVPMAALTSAVKAAIASVSPDIGLEFHIYRTLVRESLSAEQLMATLSSFFGAVAVLLAAIGLYGVISYMVARRTNEIGIRMALGAQGGDIIGMILREAGMLLAAGLALGTGLALAVATAAKSLLFGLKPTDPATIALGVCALAIIALASSFAPARRAARLDPIVALREE